MRHVQPQRGLTLLEILIAVTILAMLMTGMGMALNLGTRVWGRTDQRIEIAQRMRLIQEIVGSQIRSMVPYFVDDRDREERIMQLCVSENRIDFVTGAESLMAFDETSSLGLREISFYVEDFVEEGAPYGLVMREAPVSVGNQGFVEGEGFVFQLDPYVTDVRFEWGAYEKESEELCVVGDVEWCWLEEDEIRDELSITCFDETQNQALANRMLNQLPPVIMMTITMEVPVGGDVEFPETQEIVLPPQIFRIWNGREIDFPSNAGGGSGGDPGSSGSGSSSSDGGGLFSGVNRGRESSDTQSASASNTKGVNRKQNNRGSKPSLPF